MHAWSEDEDWAEAGSRREQEVREALIRAVEETPPQLKGRDLLKADWIDTPIGADPPVNGPDTPILIGSAAMPDIEKPNTTPATNAFILKFIDVSVVVFVLRRVPRTSAGPIVSRL